MMLMTEFVMVDHVAETLIGIVLAEDSEEGKKQALEKADEMIKKAREKRVEEKEDYRRDGVIVKQSDTLEEYSSKGQ